MANEAALKSAFETRQVTVIFDGGGAVLVAGARFGFPWKGPVWTLTEWVAAELDGISGSCVFDVWRGAATIPTSAASSIVGAGNKPTLSAAIRTAAAPAGWTDVTIDPNDEIILNLDSATTVKKVAVTLKGTVAV